MRILICVSLFLFVFGWLDIRLTAQSEISFSIQKEEIEGEEWVRVFITNRKPEDILLFTASSWDHRGLAYLRDPIAYLRFVGNPNDSITTKKTGRIVLSKTSLDKGQEYTPPLILKAGETHTEVYQLFGETYAPIQTFVETYKLELKELQVELVLHFLCNEKVYEKNILSNILDYESD